MDWKYLYWGDGSFRGFIDLYKEDKKSFITFTLIIAIGSIRFGLTYPYFMPELNKIIGNDLFKIIIIGYLLITPITYLIYKLNIKQNQILSLITLINTINLLAITLKLTTSLNTEKIFMILLPLSTALGTLYWIELQYLGYTLYNNHNRIRISTYTSTVFDMTVLIGYFLSTIIYPHLVLLFTISILLNTILIVLLLNIKTNYSIKNQINPLRIILKYKHELMLYGLVLLLYSLIELSEPFIANSISEKYAGWLLMITSIASILIVNFGVIFSLKDNTIKREATFMFASGLMLILLTNSKLAFILYPIIIPLFDSISYSIRHKIIKQENPDNTHSIMVAGLLTYGSLSPILLILTITNINYKTFILTAGILTIITSILIIHRTNKGKT